MTVVRMMVAAMLAIGATGAVAKEKPTKPYIVVNPDAGVPVFAGDITDRPIGSSAR